MPIVNDTIISDGQGLELYNGDVANNTTVNSGGSMTISNGGVANSTTMSGGSMCISSGGTANSTTMSGGKMYIHSGGVANSTTMSGGDMWISSGGVANSTTVNLGGSMTISNGGVANSTTVNSWGRVYISSGGVANSTTVNNYGCMYISSGGMANSTTLNFGGDIYISSGGVANSTTVNSGGYMRISSGGVANSTTVNSWGRVHISSGGVANSTTVNGSMYISNGGVANSTTMSGGDIYISSGGVANSTTVNDYGYMYISSGGVANSTTVNSSGSMYISSGGTANSTTVNDYGSMHISSGGVANSTTVNSGGYMFISSGGVANSTTVNSGGYMWISSGGVANSTTVNSGGDMYIHSGGVANSTTVNNFGYLYIHSGGSATEIVENGGYVEVQDGAEATFAANTISGLVLSNGSMTVHKNTIAESTTVNYYGGMFISSGGTANSTTVNSDSWMYISSGGVATNIVASNGAMLYITVAPDTYIQGTYNGSAFEMKNAQISGYTVNGGLSIYSGGTANNTIVDSNGYMCISSGGTATAIVEIGGWVDISDGANATFASNTIDGITVSASMTVHKNTVAYNIVIDEMGAMYIYSGGIANNIIVSGYEIMFMPEIEYSEGLQIYSGGTAGNITVNANGYVFVASGGTATNINWTPCIGHVVSENGAHVTYANTISGVYFGSNNTLLFHADSLSDKVVSGTMESFATMYVMDGGTADNTVIANDYSSMFIYSGGTANATNVKNWGRITLFNGGTANKTTLNNAYMYVSSGGTANSTTVNSYGMLHVLGGGITNNAIINSGYVNISSGAVAYNTIVKNEMASMYILSGGTAVSTTVSRGTLSVESGGMTYSTILTGQLQEHGAMNIYGIASDTTIDSYGRLIIANDGIHRGTLQNTGYVYAYSGSIIDFTVSERTIADGYLISNLSRIEGAPTYTITVSADQEFGTYKLAQGADNFTGSITIGDNTTTYGSITVNGDALVYNGASYTLTQTNGNLTLGITKKVLPSVFIYSSGTLTYSDTEIAGAVIAAGGNNSMYISSGGVANSTTVNNFGYMHISSGVANNTTVDSDGSMAICEGGAADNTILNSGGHMTVERGGTATNIVWTPCVGYFRATDGAYITFASAYSGVYFGSNDQLLSHTDSMHEKIIEYGGSMCVMSGGIADRTTIHSGRMYVYSGGTANNTFLETADMINGCRIHVHHGGIANNTIVNCYGGISVSSGGVANYNEINDLGIIVISSGGVAENTIINSGGRMRIGGDYISGNDGGTASNTTVNSYGSIYIDSGNTHRGSLNIESGALVSAYLGSFIDFTVSDRTTEDGYLINDLSLISGAPTYTITVSADQAFGTYKLAQGASNFTGTVSIGDETTIYGSITVNSDNFEYGEKIYSLNQDNGNLLLTIVTSDIVPPDAPDATADITTLTNQDVVVTVVYSEDSVIKQYRTGKNDEWQDYIEPFTVSENGTIYFRAEDAAGNESTSSLVVTNIDKVAPTLELTADITTPTNGNVVLTATVSDGTVEYFADGKWTAGDSLTVNTNGTYQFRVTDLAGNVTEKSIDVTNIDKVAPEVPCAVASTTEITNKDVTVSVTYSEDSTVKQYKIGENGEWQNYTGSFAVKDNVTVYFRAADAAGNESTSELVINNIDQVAPKIPAQFNAAVSGYTATLDWNDVSDSGIAGVKGYYIRYGKSADLNGDGEFVIASEFYLNYLDVSTYYYQVKAVDNAGNTSDWSEVNSIVINPVAIKNLKGSAECLSWDAIPGAKGYIVEYSTDYFATVFTIETTGTSVDLLDLPKGKYQWRVKAIGVDLTSNGSNITSNPNISEPDAFISNNNGNMDLFFAQSKGKWGFGYAAEYQGYADIEASIELQGKNRIKDVFCGSDDANILVLTDDANGDALFIDDIYSAFGDQLRMSNIDEIRAGAGDDIVDMTSRQFAYVGDGAKIYGGLGNDTIWASNGDNTIFGDAGNDRIIGGNAADIIAGGTGNDSMHGGGGNDIFTFGGDWGNDIVEQLGKGKVTLWFETDNGIWDEKTLTYTAGENSVTVSGVSVDKITLKFGDDNLLFYDELVASGCFNDAASEKIFEDKDKGMLA